MRQQLLSYLTSQLTGAIKTSQELPFSQGGNPLYRKNMRKVYVGNPEVTTTVITATLDGQSVRQTETKLEVFLAVDAKNRPVNLDTALGVMAAAVTQSGISNSFRNEYAYVITIDEDVEVYVFTYTFTSIA